METFGWEEREVKVQTESKEGAESRGRGMSGIQGLLAQEEVADSPLTGRKDPG